MVDNSVTSMSCDAPLLSQLRMRTILRAFARLLCACVFSCAASAQTPPIRIMPLGDSITDGSSFDSPDGGGGYRLPLYNLLTSAGYNVDYIGSLTINSGLLTEKEHEGHSGWRIDQLDTNMASWLSTMADPDVVLMHIGTNDFGQNFNRATAIDRLDALIVKIATLRPYAHIVVTNLMERGEPQNTQIQNEFNLYVQDRVNAHFLLGRRVTFLDMRAAVPLADMPDNLHPSQTGYNKMADAWLPAIQAVISPNGDNLPPGVYRALGTTDRLSVKVTFSKPIADASAVPGNYSIDGLTISGASLDATKRVVTLNTGLQALGTTYTVTINNVQDRIAPTANTIAPNSTVTFVPAIPRGYSNHIAESAGYTLVTSLDLPNIANYGNVAPAYSVDNRKYIGQFSRIAYYLELQTTDGGLQYLWTSMDAFTNDINKVSVPTSSTGALFQQAVSNLTVVSNVSSIVNGTGLTGNVELWPTNYSFENGVAVPGASAAIYDFGDTRTPSGTYGSMQVHNTDAGQTLFAFNNWGGTATTGNADLGIGNNPSASANNSGPQKDWTFANNAGTYTVKTIQVLVQTSSDLTPPTLASATASFGRSKVTVTFSEPVAPASVDAANFSVDNGVSVLATSLAANQRDVILTTTVLPNVSPITLTVSGVRDSSPNANLIVPGSTVVIGNPSLPAEITTNVGVASNGYHLVYSADLPVTGNLVSAGATAYSYDERSADTPFSRVAYYLELQKPGQPSQFVWVSMDTFALNRNRIGIPTPASGIFYQQTVSNMDVVSNVAGVTNGTGIATGNIEFWPSNYSAANAINIPNASASTLDFGDGGAGTGSGYGSMQIHNHGASQTLFAINHFGADGSTLDLGIGNQSTSNPDWTFAANAGTYSRRLLHVLVLPGNPTPASVLTNVPEAANYRLVASANLPTLGNLNNATIYSWDNRSGVPQFSRIGYYMELQKPADPQPTFVWASMDAYTTDPLKVGVPTSASGASFQQILNNLNVVSNSPAVTSGTGITTGNIEFWPTDYSAGNAINIPGASGSAYDFGDTKSATGGHGSMQIHNHGSAQTLFSITNWGTAGNTTNKFGLGIGSQATGSPDWTFAANSDTYSRRILHVFVLPSADTTGPTLVRVAPSPELNRVLVTFSEPLADSAANPGNFTIDNGVTVTGATIIPGNTQIALTTSAQTPGTAYTLTVSGVRDRILGNAITPGSTITFSGYQAPAILGNIPETSGYKLIHRLAIPSAVPRWNVNDIPYSIDETKYGEMGFDRVAYLLELDGNWAYVSFDRHTNSITKVGIPTLGVTATAFQQNVAHMNVASNVVGVTTGTDIATGNIEFWGGNYGGANALNVPNANNTLYDIGDQMNAGTHGCLQVHNYGAGQTILAYNNWGTNTTGNSDVGIGNNPNASSTTTGGQFDWTFANNAGTVTTKNLYVLARPAALVGSGPAPTIYSNPTSRTAASGGTTSFAVGVLGAGPFTYQWRFNGNPITGATKPWLDLDPVTAGSAGTYDVVVTSATAASTTSLGATLSVGGNAAPVFSSYRFTARRNTPSALTATAILAKASDANNDTLVLNNVSAGTTGGGTVGFAGGIITYTPANNFTGADAFTVTIGDGNGGSVSGTVNVTVLTLVGGPARESTVGIRGDGKLEALFSGTAGASYAIERTTNLGNPLAWQVIATGTVGDDGLIPLLDNNPPADKAFYRVVPGT